MLERLESVPWSSFAQPPANESRSVPDAIRGLAAAASEADAREASHRFSLTVGNDRSGAYSALALETLPFLEELLRGAALHPRNAALQALLDLATTFAPATAHMSALTDPVRMLALDLSADRATRVLASDLLDLLLGGGERPRAR